jgi:photosystem II stability/assembly factor-like uncharacterized protein
VVRFGVILIATVQPLLGEWQAIGPFGGPLQTVAADPHHANVVMAASANAAVFQSRDAGESWTFLPFPVESRAALHTLVFDPVRPRVIFAALTSERSEYAGVFRSVDSGGSWQQLRGMRGEQVWCIALSADGEVAAGTESGLYLSDDAGENWRTTAPGDGSPVGPVVSLAFDSHQPGVLYLGTPHLAWKTSEHGAKWTPIHDGMFDDSDVFSLAVDPLTPGRIYSSACSGLYMSSNAGTNWTRAAMPRGVLDRTYLVAAHPSLRGYVYAGTASGIAWSVDGGAHWKIVSSRLARAVAFDPLNLNRLYVATDDGILRSDDGGSHLRAANQGLSTWRLSRFTESNDVLYAGSTDASTPVVVQTTSRVPGIATGAYTLAASGVLYSRDLGRVWIHLRVPGRIGALLAGRGDVLLVACGSAMFRSTDGGGSWSPLDMPPLNSSIRDIVALGDTAVAAYTDHEVIWSPDGIHWSGSAALPRNAEIHGLAGGLSGVLLAATSAGLMRSPNSGQSWSPVAHELGASSAQAVARAPLISKVFAVAVFGAVYISGDDGVTWRRLSPEGALAGPIRQLLFSADSRRLFALTEGHGVFLWSQGDSPVRE